MANIERLVNVQISLNTTGVTQYGFSTLLVVGPHLNGLNRVEIYTDPDQMLEGGFTSTDLLYRAVVDAFSQTPRPQQVKVGRQAVNEAVVDIKMLGEKSVYSITVASKDVDGNVKEQSYAVTNDGGDALGILSLLQAAVAADPDAVVTAEIENNRLKLTGQDPEKAFRLVISDLLTAKLADSAENYASTLAAVAAEDNDWYGLAITSRKQEDILAVAEWTEAHKKLFGTAISEAGAKDKAVKSDTGSLLMQNNYFRTHWWYHAAAVTEYPETAVMARCFAIDPGGETWANKKLAGVAADNLTETQFNAIKSKNGNTFETFRNVSITQIGKVAAGEWIDVIRFRDWLEEQIMVNVFTLLINRDKIPYTDGGIALIETQVRAALDLGQRRGGVAPTEFDSEGNENPGYTIDIPLSADIAFNDKANRVLNDVRFMARLAGAIHVVNIKGSLTYENLFSAS